MLPLDICEDLTAEEQANLKKRTEPGLTVHSVALRYYPNGGLGAHLIGFASPHPLLSDDQIQGDKVNLVETVGRDGLELTLNDQLAGKLGKIGFSFDFQGHKVSEKVSVPPQPGNNVVTTIDADIQRLCEKALKEGAKRGAIVIIDPANGDVLAMASWPTFDPNLFVPTVSSEQWKSLTNDPNLPLVGRAFRAAYPPGGTFKPFVGLAALQSGAIKLDEKIHNPPFIQLGDRLFHDWKNSDRGMLSFAEALEQGADTWFYQVGIKTGAKPIADWAVKFGFSRKTGIPLPGEAPGVMQTEGYLKEHFPEQLPNKNWAEGMLANLSIGQGPTQVTPIQMAQAMATLGNGGTLYQPRLVKRVQNEKGKTIGEYNRQRREQLDLKPEILTELKKSMVAVVNGPQGTGRSAAIHGTQVAGETGAGQFRSADKSRMVGWFAGFAPADQPKYAFAAVYEGEPDETVHGGTVAAPMIGKVLRELFASEAEESVPRRSLP
jgi:penicillin-binding protein 2